MAKPIKEIIKKKGSGPFFERCYILLKKVPRGKVTTYKALAHALGTGAYRAVGQAMNKNPYAPQVPCHRVVASDGSIGGFAHGTKKKMQMLRKEGISFEIKDGIVFIKDFGKRHFDFLG